MGAAGGVMGLGMQLIGQSSQDQNEAFALYQNGIQYQNQAKYIETVGQRKLDLLKREQDDFFDKQKSRFAMAGVGFDGSVLAGLVDTKLEQEKETQAVMTDTAMQANLARFRGQQSMDQASYMGSSTRMFFNVGGTAAQGAMIFGGK